MPQYATNNTGNLTLNTQQPSILWPGDSLYLLGTSQVAGQPPTPGIIQAANDTNVQFETAGVNYTSIAASFAPRPGGGAAPGASILVVANGNPGVMEVDVQLSPMDSDGSYLLPTGSSTYKINSWTGPTGPNGYYFAWEEFEPLSDFFARLKVITNPNAVKLTAKLNYV